mmetsp:Transcript_90020/g.159405  ORF Transcript_90020/g.159405 Transcript_90020/m.159405 type:complete len:460 (+) Transcript_90020:98-1477(+)
MLSRAASSIAGAMSQRRAFGASAIVTTLQAKTLKLADHMKPQFMKLRKEKGDKKIGEVNVMDALRGAKGIPIILSETSMVDPALGVKYRGFTLEECNEKLPKAPGSKVGLPEAAWWLLMTGEMPSDKQAEQLRAELHARETIPDSVLALIDGFDKKMHPMTQLSLALLAMQPYSAFYNTYREGWLRKRDYWRYVLEDSLDLIARIPLLSARIFRNVFYNGKHIPSDPSLDWAANYAQMLGVNNSEGFKEVTRLYLMIHADHSCGNVCAHTTHLVGSALSDPYLSFAAGVNGLAGPLHGLGSQDCMRWLRNVKAALGDAEPTVEIITQFAKDTLTSGQVIPGFGHGALRITDPRYTMQRQFASENFPDDDFFKLANVCFEAIPPVLQAKGKVKNPWPNTEALSGTCMQHYGLTQEDYYTVVFAVSRALGVTANLVWSRLMGLPIERPKSVTLDWLDEASK